MEIGSIQSHEHIRTASKQKNRSKIFRDALIEEPGNVISSANLFRELISARESKKSINEHCAFHYWNDFNREQKLLRTRKKFNISNQGNTLQLVRASISITCCGSISLGINEPNYNGVLREIICRIE